MYWKDDFYNMRGDLTRGKIFSALLRLAIPLAGGSVMQMAYNLLDMFWLGRVSGEAVAATGAAGLFIWLSVGLMTIGNVGAEVGVSQARGRGDFADAYRFSRASLYISAALGLIYGAFLFLFRAPLVGFFRFQELQVAADASAYTGIIAFGIPAMFISSTIGSTFVASGNSRTPFIINSIGLILNMILTPVMILPLGFGLGVFGAAVSSGISKYFVLILSLIAVKHSKNRPFDEYRFRAKIRIPAIVQDLRTGTANKIFRLTIPVCLENTLWPLLTLVTTRIEVSFGAFALTISRVGVQVESLIWLVGGGFGGALTSFVGQNFGAGKSERISRGVKYTAYSMIAWAGLVMIFMWFAGGFVFRIFLPEYVGNTEMRSLFITHMRILAAFAIPFSLHIVAGGAFQGEGKTIPPSVTSIASNLIRVPLAFFLSRTSLGVLGVWFAISFTAGLRGLSVFIWYLWDRRKSNAGRLR